MLLIYLPVITPRSEYIFNLVFIQHLGLQYCTTTDLRQFKEYPGEKINYSDKTDGNSFFIRSSQFLDNDSIKIFRPEVSFKNEIKVLFPDEESHTGFDIFAAIFYMVSRYEEYLPFTPDVHDRFSEKESIAYRNDFLHQPVVDHWIIYLKKLLDAQFPLLKYNLTNKFKAIATYDIDVAFKYKGRSFLRQSGALVHDFLNLDLKNILNRLKVLTGLMKDNWDVYEALERTLKEKNTEAIFFFLLGKKTKYDRNLDPLHPSMKQLIKKINAFAGIGIHPSYFTRDKPAKVNKEKRLLEEIADKEIIRSRQHFLRFELPGTYLNLISAGITEEYSMGFSNACGFRAGTSHPFYFYDLKNEKTTSLQIFPVTYMEGTFFEKHSPQEALQIMKELLHEVKKVNGIFITIWHNHTISEDHSEWKKIHDQMLDEMYKIT